ncbi:hypothetical protein KPO80_004390, partial [Enterobacter hormaechei]|nr:hypothetical protein [Enterobacter hormaechei]
MYNSKDDKQVEVERKNAIWIDNFLEKLLTKEYLNPPFNINGDIATDFSNRCENYIELIDKAIKEDVNEGGKYL